jgi:predicted porin
MKKKLMALAILGALAGATQAQTVQDLQQALAQAQKAAADAQKAAQQAMDALAQIQQASAASNKQATTPVAVSKAMTTDANGSPLQPETSGVSLYNDSNTSLHMYGLVEATISDAQHQTSSGGTAAGFQTAWFSGNRLGFDAAHALAFGDDIGLPGLKVISKLETEFELPTGNMDTANVFFNRDAWLGLYSDDLGKLTLGRQNTLTRDFTANWGDPYGAADVSTNEGGYSNVNNFKQLIFYSGGANGTRLNSAIEWKKKLDKHWLVGIGYGFGSGGSGGSGDVGNGGSTPGDFTKGTTREASVAYNALDLGFGKLSVNASLDRANVADLIHQSELVGGNLTVGPVRFNAGYIHYTAEQGANNSIGTRTDNAWTTSIKFIPGGKMEYDLGYQRMKGDHAGFGGGGNMLNPFGNTSGVTTVADGGKNTLYGSIVYHADKQMDFYLAADYFTTTGNWVVGDAQGNGNHFGVGNPYSSEAEAAMGMRFKF